MAGRAGEGAPPTQENRRQSMSKTTPRGVSRRSVLAAAAALPLVTIWSKPARAAEFSYKLATGQSLDQPINARLKQAIDRIREASSGCEARSAASVIARTAFVCAVA